MNHAFLVLLGMGTVFVGLICLVFLCQGMGALVQKFEKIDEAADKSVSAPAPVAASTAPIADRQAIIAAACAVIAEELGTEVKNIKVTSFKRM